MLEQRSGRCKSPSFARHSAKELGESPFNAGSRLGEPLCGIPSWGRWRAVRRGTLRCLHRSPGCVLGPRHAVAAALAERGRWGRKDGPAVWQLPAECRRGSEWRRRSGRVVEWATEVRGPAVRTSPRGNWGLLGRSRLPEQQVLDYDEERIEKLLAFEQVIQLRATDPGKRPPRLAEAGQALAPPGAPGGLSASSRVFFAASR